MERRVVCAANKFFFDDGKEKYELVVSGVRHYDAIMRHQIRALNHEFWRNKTTEIQGFLDNKGEFLTREEAWTLARLNNQILRLVGGQTSVDDEHGVLYSENLY